MKITTMLKQLVQKRNTKGNAIILVLFVFMFMMISSATILYVQGANLRQAKKQEQYIESYYLAYSGCEIGWQALMNDGGKLLKDIKDNMKASSIKKWGPQKFEIQKTDSISNDYLDGGEIIVEILAETPNLPVKDEEIMIYINSRGIHNVAGRQELRDLCLMIKAEDLTYRQYLSELYNTSITGP